MVWFNNDGLLVKFGREEAIAGVGGEYSWRGFQGSLEVEVDYRRLNAFGTPTILSDVIRIPNGIIIKSAEFQVADQAFSTSGSPTLSFGLYKTDRTTAYSATGIHSALAASAVDTIGENNALTGSLINTTVLASTTPSLLSCTVGTANFTAGRGKLRIHWFWPTPAANPAA